MRELKLFADTVVLTGRGPVLAADANLTSFIDGFGNVCEIASVTKSGKSKAALIQLADHGDPFVLPADALVKPRTPDDARYAPVEVAKLSREDHFFLLPNRKMRLAGKDPETALPAFPTDLVALGQANSAEQLVWLLQFLEHVEKNDAAHVRGGLFLKFEDIFQARIAGELLGLSGVKVYRHPTRPWIYPDQRRPSCVVAKLLAGVLHGDACADVLYEFYGKGIIQPCGRVDDTLIGRCQDTGVMVEGQPVENLVKLHQVRVSERERETVTLTVTNDAHVETTWAQL